MLDAHLSSLSTMLMAFAKTLAQTENTTLMLEFKAFL
jgi:hypothetical protein